MEHGTPAANKKLVADFIQAFYNDKDFSRARELMAEDFVNHRADVGAGREGTLTAFQEQVAANLPEFGLQVVRSGADEDLVWTHNLIRPAPGADPVVSVDIFRVRDGRVCEHWDVAQPVPAGMEVGQMVGEA
jgi:predicted SnoaL-like aldol condensation-catalyzing enzyme